MPKTFEKARLLEIRKVAEHTFRLTLYAPRTTATAKPGQFVMVRAAVEGSDPLLNRPFSFHRILKEDGLFEILLRVVGRGTQLLSQRREGTLVEIIGPLGKGFRAPSSAQEKVALVAGGIGVAPLYGWAIHLSEKIYGKNSHQITFFYGARTKSEFIPARRLQRRGIQCVFSTDDGSQGFCGTVVDLVRETRAVEKTAFDRMYVCGPLSMQAALAGDVLSLNIPVEMSLESVMGCGIGACLGCVLPAVDPEDPSRRHYVHVCTDGPVLDAGRIRWEEIEPMPYRPLSLVCG